MKPLYLNILLFLALSSCYNPDSSQSIQDLNGLTGKWKSREGVLFNENWRSVNSSLLEGEGFSIVDNDTAFFESLKIRKIGDSIYYQVFFGNETTSVDFHLVEATRNSWTFINPENEFPQKIFYELDNDTTLNVTVSDMDVNKKQFFFLAKIR